MKSGFDSNLRQWQPSSLHETNGFLKPLSQHKLMRRDTDCGAELAREMKRADPCLFRENVQRDILLQMGLNKVDDRAKLKRIELSFRNRSLGFRDSIIRQQVESKSDRQRVRIQQAVTAIRFEFRTKRLG